MITIGNLEFMKLGKSTTLIYYRSRGASGVQRSKIGMINARRFTRCVPATWPRKANGGNHLSMIQSSAALHALKLGLIGPP